MSKQSEAVEVATTTSQNMSFEQLIERRTQARSEPEETEELAQAEDETETEEAEEVTEEAEETTEGEEATEETEDEEQEEIDLLLSKTPAEIQELAKKGKSRLLQRIGELTAKNKALEEQQRTTPGTEAKPLQAAVSNIPEDIRSLKTVADIQAKYTELERVAEDTDRILEDHEDYASDDVIKLGNKEFTKKDIRLANRNARAALLKFLPAQAAEIQRSEQRTAMEAEYTAAIPLEIPEMADAEHPMAQQFAAMSADPLIAQVRQQVPELAPQIGYLLAHAIRSMNSKKIPATARPTATGTPVRPKVPAAPFGAAGPSSSRVPVKKQAEQAYENFEKTGSPESWIAARIAQRANQ